MRTSALSAMVPILALATACRPPAAPPRPPLATEDQVAEAGAAALDPGARQEYLEGFHHGARMVRSAVQEGRRPYRLKIGFAPQPPLPHSPQPEGFRVVAPPPAVEMDPETGLPWAAPMGGDGPWARGAVAGFEWAMAGNAGALRSLGFLRPSPVPQRPPEGAWIPWPEPQAFLTVEGPNLSFRLKRSEGVLLWDAAGRGFAPVRAWRPTPGLVVDRMAAQDDVLWLNLSSGQALALDRDTGFVRAVAPGLPPLPGPRTPPGGAAPAEGADRSWEGERAEAQRLAEAGDPYGMVCLAKFLAPRRPAEGLAWLRKAAERGYPRAMVHLGLAYLEGKFGLETDRAEARRWIEKAARAGDAEAKAGLRMLFGE